MPISLYMKSFKLLPAAFVGVFFYVLISFVAGKDGIFAEKQLLKQKIILSTRAEKIQRINESLQLEYTALEKDLDVIKALAHKLGYVCEGERIVKINGLDFSDDYRYDVGTPIKAEKPETFPEYFAKAIGLIVFITVYLYLLLKDVKNGAFKIKKRKTVFTEGITVYDLPQI